MDAIAIHIGVDVRRMLWLSGRWAVVISTKIGVKKNKNDNFVFVSFRCPFIDGHLSICVCTLHVYVASHIVYVGTEEHRSRRHDYFSLGIFHSLF